MLKLEQIILGGVLPGVASLVVLLVGWRGWSRKDRPRSPWAAPLAMSLGFVAGYIGIHPKHQIPPFTPDVGEDWIFYIAILAGVIGIFSALLRLPNVVRAIFAAGVSALAAYLLISRLPGVFNGPEGTTLLIVSGVAMFLWIVSAEVFAARAGGLRASIVLSVLTIATSMILMMSGSQTIGQWGGAAAATVCAAVPVAFLARGSSLAYGAFVIASILGGLLIIGKFYNDPEPPVLHIALLWATPILAAISTIPALSRTAGRRAISSAIALAPALLAVTLTAIAFAKAMSEKSNSPYSY